jgi:hypothetical protein
MSHWIASTRLEEALIWFGLDHARRYLWLERIFEMSVTDNMVNIVTLVCVTIMFGFLSNCFYKVSKLEMETEKAIQLQDCGVE